MLRCPNGTGNLAGSDSIRSDRALLHHRRVGAEAMTQLSLEQQFALRAFEAQAGKMSQQQAQEFLVKLYEQMLIREAIYREMLRKQWGME